jgi:hypothetical protein
MEAGVPAGLVFLYNDKDVTVLSKEKHVNFGNFTRLQFWAVLP